MLQANCKQQSVISPIYVFAIDEKVSAKYLQVVLVITILRAKQMAAEVETCETTKLCAVLKLLKWN